MATEREFLATYLHDHLSAATAATELLRKMQPDIEAPALSRFFTRLRAEICWERDQLAAVASHFPVPSGPLRRAAAWVGEKGLELKLAVDGSTQSHFQIFEALETLSVGIAGKRLLWRTLSQESVATPELKALPFKRLIQMAVRQRRALETFRLEAARESLRAHLRPRPGTELRAS